MKKLLRRHWPLFVILGLAFLLRLPLLAGSFWLDEAAQALESARPWHQQLQITDDFQPPLLHLLTYMTIHLSHQEWWLRFWGALLPGLFTIAGTYCLTRHFSTRRAAIAAAALLATSSFHIFYSQELRPYSLSAVWVVWSWYFLLRASSSRSRLFWCFLLTTIAGLYSSYLYPFVFGAQLVYLLVCRHYRQCSYAFSSAIIAFLPWLPAFLDQLQAGQTLRLTFPGWENIVSFTFVRSSLLTVAKFIYGVLDVEVNFFFVAGTLLIVVLMCMAIFTQFHLLVKQKRIWFQLTIILILPFLAASLISLFVPVVQPKRVIFLLPFFYLTIAILVFGTRQHRHRVSPVAFALPILLLIINLFSTFCYYTDARLQRENWRDLLATLHRDWDVTDTAAVFAYQAPFSPWVWYEQTVSSPFPTFSTGTYDTSTLVDLNAISLLDDYSHIIVFDYLRELTDREDKVLHWLEDHHFVAGKIYTYHNLGQVRIYEKLSL
ncbi:glycosyltransferase family 39 protein [bacterium]|nr:glycosyltransferase family 39 protein [bacterium]